MLGKTVEAVSNINIGILGERVAVQGFGPDLDLVDYQIRDDIRYAHTPDEVRAGDGPAVYIPHCGTHGFPREMGGDVAGQIATAVLLANPENLLAAFEAAEHYAESHVPTQIIVYRMTATDDERDRGIEDISHDDLQDLIITTPVALRLDRITVEVSTSPNVRLNDVMIQRLVAMVEAAELEQLYRAMNNA